MSVSTVQAIRNYTAGTWKIDPSHSEIGFSVRHMMVSKARGKFTRFGGQIVTTADPLDSSAAAIVEMGSVDTGDSDRDEELRSSVFFDVETYPTMDFRSTMVRNDGEDYVLDGDLTIKGVTRPISLHVELGGFGPDLQRVMRVGFTATGLLNRREFGVNYNRLLDTGGVVVADQVNIHLEIEAVLSQ